MTLPPFPAFCADVLGLDLSTRTGHMTIARVMDALPLNAEELALFQRYTGRDVPRAGGYPYALVLTGRQSGKTEQAAARLVYAAASVSLAGARDVSCVGISQDHRAAQRVLFQYVATFFEQPLLRPLVATQTLAEIILVGGVRVLVLPCRPAAIRGLRCACVVLDEVAHFRSTDNIPLDKEAWRAALPTLLTTNGKLFALSSPYLASGLAYDQHAKHYGRDASDVLVWQSPNYILNPLLSVSALDQIREADADGAAAEIEGQFLMDVSALLDEQLIMSSIDAGVTVRPRCCPRHVAHVDVSTGTHAHGDRWACAIAHRDGATAVLDALLVIHPPFSVATAAQQTAALCRQYDVREIHGDRFAQGFSSQIFVDAGLRWTPAERTTSDSYIDFAGMLGSGRVRLLDRDELLRELRTLERRRGPTRDCVDHRRNAHDDAAAAVAGACVAALDKEARPKQAVASIAPHEFQVPAWQREYFR